MAIRDLRLDGGLLEGYGNCEATLVNAAGAVSPGGDEIAALNVTSGSVGWGTFTQAAAGRLVVDVGGLTSHDRLTVRSSATLGGLLEVRLAGAYVPAAGDEFTILTASSINGRFAETRLLTPSPGVRFEAVYQATEVRLRAVRGP